MRIGKYDIGFSLLIHVALVGVLGVALYRVFVDFRAQRVIGQLATRICAAQNEGGTDSWATGVEDCRSILALDPTHLNARFHLGTLLFKLGKYSDARDEFERIGQSVKANEDQAARAFTAAATSVLGASSPGEDPALDKDAQKLLEKALQKKKDSPDALTSLAVMKLWKEAGNKASFEELRAISSGAQPPGLIGSVALYNGLGLAAFRNGDSTLANRSFLSALALRPQNTASEENRRWTALSGLTSAGLGLKERQALIDQFQHRTKSFGKSEPLALNALAIGFWRMRKDLKPEEYLEKPYPDAVKILRTAISRFPKDPWAYLNLAGLFEDRLYGDSRINEEPGLWQNLPEELRNVGVREYLRRNPWIDQKMKLTEAEIKQIADIHSLAMQEYKIISEMLTKATPADVEVRWLAEWHRFIATQTIETIATTEKDQAEALKNMAQSAGKLVELKPQSAESWLAQARVHLLARSYPKGIEALKKIQALGQANNTVLAAIERAALKPELFDCRPRNHRWFGKRPLLGASIDVRGLPGRLTAYLMFDGQELPATLSGSQILLLGGETIIKDGTHQINVRVVDAMGMEASKTFSFILDKRPPDLKIDPVREVKGPRPVWKVTLSDAASGLDLTSVGAILKLNGTTGTPIHLQLLRQGIYQQDLEDIQVKKGDPLKSGSFQLTVDQDLKPGVYGIVFTCADKAGNQHKESCGYILR